MLWSRAAPCWFLHLASERSSITEGIVQAETPPPPVQSSLFQLPSSFPARRCTRNSHIVDFKHRGYCTAKLSLQHISKYTHDGIPPPRHHPAFAVRQRAQAPGSSGSQAGSTWEGRGKLVPSAPCQAQFTDPFHTRLMLLHAEWRGTMDISQITTQRAVGDWGSLRGERGGPEADLPMFPSNIHMSLMPVLISKNCLQLSLWWEETDTPNRNAT